MDVAVGEATFWIGHLPRHRLREAAALAAEAWDLRPDPARLQDALSAPDTIALIALDAANPYGPMAGLMTARLAGRGIAVSDETVVRPPWRGRGVGAALVHRMAEVLRALGVHELRGESSEHRTRELAFFFRLGFRVVDCRVARGLDWVEDGVVVYETALAL